jgi:hypothetical protein
VQIEGQSEAVRNSRESRTHLNRSVKNSSFAKLAGGLRGYLGSNHPAISRRGEGKGLRRPLSTGRAH